MGPCRVSHTSLLGFPGQMPDGTCITQQTWQHYVLASALACFGLSFQGVFLASRNATERCLCYAHVQGIPPAALPDQLPALLDTSAPFRDTYLAAALGRMQEAVTAAFPGSARVLPSPADVQKCIG